MMNHDCSPTRRVFCAELRENSQDPMLGTAMDVDEYLFISWPKRLWEAQTIASRQLPPQLIELIETRNKKPLFRLVSQRETSLESISIWYFSNRGLEYRELTGLQVGDLVPAVQRLFDREVPLSPLPQSRFLICTHAKNDLCCGRLGRPVYNRAKQIFENSSFEVWEVSHLGGHRFAATALSIPSGRMYGRITEEDLVELCNQEKNNAPLLKCYRGSVWLSEREQFVEAIAYKAAIELFAGESPGFTRKNFVEAGQTVRGSFSTQQHHEMQIVVTFRTETYSTIRNCSDVEGNRARITERSIPVMAVVTLSGNHQRLSREITSPLAWFNGD